MTLKIEQQKLVGNVKAVGRLVTNKAKATEVSHLKIIQHKGYYWLSGFISEHSLLIRLDKADNKNSDSINLSYNRVWNLINYLRGEISLNITDEKVFIKDENASTDLVNIMFDNNDIQDIDKMLEEVKSVKSKGVKINRKDFHEALIYLRGIQDREERSDLETGIMLTPKESYVISDMFAVRYNYQFPQELVLDSTTTKTLLDLLSNNSEEEEFTFISNEDKSYFLIGKSIYEVTGLVDEVDERVSNVFIHRDTTDKIVLNRAECLRILNLTKVLTDSVEPDVIFEIKDTKGRIYTQSRDGDAVDGKFPATECSDTMFTVSVESMVSVISKLKDTVGQDLTFDVVIIPEEFKDKERDVLHLKYDSGECIFSINPEIEGLV